VDYYVAANRDSDARSVLASMNAADDVSGDLSVRLAAVDSRSGKPAEAVRRLDSVLARAPNNAAALLLKAQILFAQGNPDPRFARTAVIADPRSIEARLVLGQTLLATGELGNAVEHYEEARRLDPGARAPLLALARLALALGRAPEALKHAREALRLDPNDRDAVLVLVKALILNRDYETADVTLKPLLSGAPDAPDVLVQAGVIQAARRTAH
jgi:tetratricopeptide (TPR) repeat protein